MQKYAESKFYKWGLMSYADIEDIQNILDIAKHWAYIKHDKDISSNLDESGKQKLVEPHYHIVLILNSQMTLSAIRKRIGSDENTLGQELKFPKNLYDYLLHDEYTDKIRYSEKERYCDNINYWENLKKNERTTKKNDAEELIDDILKGLSFREMARKYGRDYMRNYFDYTNYAKLVKEEDKLIEQKKEYEKITTDKGIQIISMFDEDEEPF